MAENQEKSGLNEAASVAQTVAGAVKTGKALASAAKGASVGGPYGAVAGALWGARKHIGKIIAAAALLLLLPLLFVLLLPPLIFGGLAGGGSPTNPELPVLNDDTAIVEYSNQIAFSIGKVLGEGIEDVKARVVQDFATSGGDNHEIVNPYDGNLTSNANALLSQYCAAKEADYKAISIPDMERVLRLGKSHLYSFTRASETRTVEADDPSTPDVAETSTELWYIYTLVYNGETYFADTIFGLTDEQKELADNYAQNLSLFLGDGIYQNNPSTGSIPSLGDVRFTDGATEVVYFNQLDERYATKPYGTDTVGKAGCGPSAMAIVVSSLSGETIDPAAMAAWAYEKGYWCSGSGSYHSLIPGAATAWGLPVSGCTAAEPQRITDALAQGKLVVAIMSKGHFTNGGHFIVLRGVQDSKILVADPASRSNSSRAWDLSLILDEASRRASAGGPFWIIG